MPAEIPADLHRLFGERFRAGDVERLVSLYEPDALFIPQPGQTVRGHAAIREALSGFISLGGHFEMVQEPALIADGIALLHSNWTLSASNHDGTPLRLAGRTSDVARRQDDGTWLVVIDDPYGGGGGTVTSADTAG